MLTIETRLSNLENLVNSLAKRIDGNKFYTDADIDGNRKAVSEITPYTETKTAYLGDTEVIFTDVKDGNLSVFVKDENGNYPDFSVDRNGDIITVYFEPLEYITTITISIQ